MQPTTQPSNTFDGITEVETKTPKNVPGKKRPVKLIISLILFVLISIALAIVLILKIYLSDQPRLSICHTKECTLASSIFLRAMDPEKDPCVDFYDFMCGEYIRINSNIDNEKTIFDESRNHLNLHLRDLLEDNSTDNSSDAVRKLKKAYQVCMNTTHTTLLGVTPLAKFLDLLGGWPLALGKSWKPLTGIGLEGFLAKMERMGFPSYLIAVSISPDPTNTSVYRIQFDQPDDSYKQLRQRQTNPSRSPIEVIMLAIAESLGNNDTTIILDDLTNIVKLSQDLQKIFTPQEKRSNHTRMYNKMTLRQLQKITGNKINWLLFLQSIFAGITEITEEEEVIVCEVEYMKKLPEVIKKHGQRVISNFAVWNAVEELIQYITPELYLTTSILRPYLNVDFNRVRWNLCLSATNQMLPYAMWRLYVDKSVDEEVIKSAEEFVGSLRKAYRRTIVLSKWLDLGTKRKALKKINSMKEFVGYPKWILDDNKLNTYYENFEIIDNHFINVVVNRMNSTQRILTDFRRPVNTELWVGETNFVNAFYSQLSNSIFFPVGILKPPFFSNNRIQALNYGSIGVIVGHEMGHGFDSDGSQFDETGELRSWWSEQSREKYVNRTQCFVNQYNEYCSRLTERRNNNNTSSSICVNGEFTVGENVADNTGVQCSYRAYQQWVKKHGEEDRLPGLEEYSPNQLFFMSHAFTWCQTAGSLGQRKDPHSPAKYRVQGPLSNFAEFARAFNCPEGPMNREDSKCTLW